MGKGGARVGAGRPRKPLAQHVLDGTYRKDRHGGRAAVRPSPARCLNLAEAYQHTYTLLAQLRALVTIGEPGTAWLLREIRMQTALLAQLGAALDKAETAAAFCPAPEPPDGFAEFDDKLAEAAGKH